MVDKLKVFVVDKSPVVQGQLAAIINTDINMVVVGVATDPYIARARIKELEPDIVTLDVNLPKMDGITFLRNLMRLHPMPVLMVVSNDEKSLALVDVARNNGAKGVFVKNSLVGDCSNKTTIDSFLETLRSVASGVKGVQKPRVEPEQRYDADAVLKYAKPVFSRPSEKLVAIGASTGGTEAILEVLVQLPAEMPAIVITQHIPGKFSGAFADRINKLCKLNVSQALNGERILPGHVYIAPGDQHLLVERRNSNYFCVLNDGPPVNRHKPSVDVLFRSVAQAAGSAGVGVLLTGMGKDGAAGLLEMQEASAPTFAQDEASSVVWGMPGAAVKLGAVDEVVALDKVANRILEQVKAQELADKSKEVTCLRRLK